MKSFTIRLPAPLLDALTAEAMRLDVGRGEIVRECLSLRLPGAERGTA